ncbi:MAG: hypothetical protein HQL38_05755, partial [Alphaproteobacteria bacterium]|nr:hypothetical protein [Alphaproteobacteria bacterium]
MPFGVVEERSGWSRALGTRPMVMAIAGFASALALASWTAMAWTDYRRTLEDAHARSADAARLLEEHARRLMTGTDLIIQRVIARIEEKTLPVMRDSGHEWERLRSLAATLPESGTLWILDARGRVDMTSLHPEAPEGDFSERMFFRAHSEGAEQFLGKIIRGGVTSRHVFTISRRLDDGEGRFAGVVSAGIVPDFFAHLHDSLGLGPGSSIALFRTDGPLLLRQPYDENMAPAILPEELRRLATTGRSGVNLVASAPIDDITSIMSLRRVRDQPIIAVAAISRDAALAPFRLRAIESLAILSASLLGLIGLTWLALRGLEREARARAALIAAKEELEERVAERTHALADALSEALDARREAVRANLAKSRFLAAASHDLRQPWQALRLFLDVLLLRLKDPKDREVAEKAGQALEGGESLLSALLDVSVLEAGTVRTEIRAVPVLPLLIRLAQECEPQAAQKGLALSVVPCGAEITTDPVLLLRILRNLMTNAIRHTARGRILLGCRHRAGGLRIEVWDTGPGIPPAEMERIFEDFYQIENAERDRNKGLGLGLSIVRRMALLLDHGIDVRSRPGRGSMFAVIVALAPSEEE